MSTMQTLIYTAVALTGLGLLGFPVHPRAASAAADDCAVPAELLEDNNSLPHTAAKLQAPGSTLTVIAIGGASTRGVGPPEQAYPARLEAELRRRYPGVAVTVINRSVARQSAAEMVKRFATDVLPFHPDLVIWETGTNDAVHGIDVDEFGKALEDGLTLLSRKDIDIILIDMQYSRQSSLVVNFDHYLEAMHHIADINDIRIFRRYSLMKYWSDNDIIEFDEPAEPPVMVASHTYDCIARRLADMIAMATQ